MVSNITAEAYVSAMGKIGELLRWYDDTAGDIFSADAEYVKNLGLLGSGVPLSQSGFPSIPSFETDLSMILNSSEIADVKVEELKDKLINTPESLTEQDRRDAAGCLAYVPPYKLMPFVRAVYGSNKDLTVFTKEKYYFDDDGTWFYIKHSREVADYKYPMVTDERSPLKFVADNLPEVLGTGAALICVALGVSTGGFLYVVPALLTECLGCAAGVNLKKFKHPLFLKDIPQYILERYNAMVQEGKVKGLGEPFEIAFIEGEVTREEKIMGQYAFHDPVAHDIFGLKFPLLVCRKNDGGISVATDKEHQASIDKFIENELFLRKFLGEVYSGGKALPGCEALLLEYATQKADYFTLAGYGADYFTLAGYGSREKKPGTTSVISEKDEGIRKLLGFAFDEGVPMEGELVSLDGQTIKSISEIVGQIASYRPANLDKAEPGKEVVEPEKAFVDRIGRVYPPALLWVSEKPGNSFVNYKEPLENFQMAVTDYLSDGGSLGSYVDNENVVREVLGIVNGHILRSPVLFRNLTKSYIVCDARQFSLEPPEGVTKRLLIPRAPSEFDFRETIYDVISRYTQESLLGKPSFLSNDGQDRLILSGEVARAYDQYKELLQMSRVSCRDKIRGVFEMADLKQRMNQEYGSNATNLMKDLRNIGEKGIVCI